MAQPTAWDMGPPEAGEFGLAWPNEPTGLAGLAFWLQAGPGTTLGTRGGKAQLVTQNLHPVTVTCLWLSGALCPADSPADCPADNLSSHSDVLHLVYPPTLLIYLTLPTCILFIVPDSNPYPDSLDSNWTSYPNQLPWVCNSDIKCHFSSKYCIPSKEQPIGSQVGY